METNKKMPALAKITETLVKKNTQVTISTTTNAGPGPIQLSI